MITVSQDKQENYHFFNIYQSAISDVFFNNLENQYIQTSQLLKELQNKLNELSIHEFDQSLSHINMLLNPKYYPLTNKDVFNKTLETGGSNLNKGFKNLTKDLKKGILPSLSNVSHFKLGENLATTKGHVVYKNDLMELIHYTPVKKNIHENPLLIIPAWINKFYIFDLGEEKSFVKYNLKKGIDVYVISWKNPDENDKHLTLGLYVDKGIEEAIQFINKDIHLLGFCLGGVGTLIASLAHKMKRIKSVSLLATPIDFSKLTELQNYVKPLDFKKYKNEILKKGYKCGKDLLRMFCMMRAENMIMDNMVNQYYLNKEPKANDFLYWNMDATNLPAKMHIEYIENFFIKNQLYRGQYRHNGEKLNLNNIDFPLFILGAEKDHIVPKESSFAISKFNLNTKFILGGSGHIAGVINPPAQKKYHYSVVDEECNILKSKKNSWWPEWIKWITPQMGEKNNHTKETHMIIDEAPGSYAKYQPALKDYV
jgi:polyhydroxyalkanoate synthase